MNNVYIARLLDAQGRLTSLPQKQEPRQAALRFLLQLFEHGRFYREKEVNELLSDRCADGDYALLRRELSDAGLLSRTSSGSRYWRSDFLRGDADCGGVTLRDLCPGDIPALLAVHASLAYYDDIEGKPFTPEDARALVDKTDLPPDGSPEFYGAKLLLTTDGRPAGYLMTYEGYPAADTLWIGALFIHRSFHRQGLGGAVVRAVAKQAAACGFKRIGLGVYALNTPGLQFWVGQGFCTVDRVSVSERGRAILLLAMQV